MSIEIRDSREVGWHDAAWDRFVQEHPAAHPLQLSLWGELKSDFGWECVRVAMFEAGKIVAGAQVLFRKLPRLAFLPARIAYIPKGPLLDWQDTERANIFMAVIQDLCRQRRALFLKIEPELDDAPPIRDQLDLLGFQPSARTIQPQTTIWLDLTADEDILLSRMKQKWRYNVRLAARKGVTVRLGGADDLGTFNQLMQTTGQRNEFGVHSAQYYRRFWELFAPAGAVALLIAEHDGVALAALMAAKTADKAYYLYGASSNEGRNLMPGHLLQWETMLWAKAQGCSAYDLWGVPDEVGLDPDAALPDPPTGLWGVWRFKRGFGGDVKRYVGAWDRPFIPGLSRFLR